MKCMSAHKSFAFPNEHPVITTKTALIIKKQILCRPALLCLLFLWKVIWNGISPVIRVKNASTVIQGYRGQLCGELCTFSLQRSAVAPEHRDWYVCALKCSLNSEGPLQVFCRKKHDILDETASGFEPCSRKWDEGIWDELLKTSKSSLSSDYCDVYPTTC